MKIRLSMPGASVVMDFDDIAAVNIFKDLAGRLIGVEGSGKVNIQPAITCNITGPVTDEFRQELREVMSNSIPTIIESEAPNELGGQVDDLDPAEEVVLQNAEEPELTEAGLPALNSQGYKGFLHIRCEECGRERTFCTKETLEFHRCTCGHDTPLRDLYDIWALCECGRKSLYKTNSDEYAFDINCVCGIPVAVKWSKVRRNYQTIQ